MKRPGVETLARRATLPTLVMLVGAALRGLGLSREGFSPDEEITFFAIQGIVDHGLPVLPSGALYTRGLLYSYTAWAFGAIAGHDIAVYRACSAVFGIATVALTFMLARELCFTATGRIAAAAITAILPPLVAVAQWARFYSMFLAFWLLALWLFIRALERRRGGSAYPLVVIAAALLHELAVLLAMLPLISTIFPSHSIVHARARRLVWMVVPGLVAPQAVLFAAHAYLTPRGAAAVANRLDLRLQEAIIWPPTPLFDASPFVVALAACLAAAWHVWLSRVSSLPRVYLMLVSACAFAYLPGLLAAATIFAMIATPSRSFGLAGTCVATIAAATPAWAAAVAFGSDSPLTLAVGFELLRSGLSIPLDSAVFLLSQSPSIAVLLMAGALAVIWRGTPLIIRERGRPVAQLAVLTLMSLGLLGTGFDGRYFLPVVVLAIALAAAIPDALALVSTTMFAAGPTRVAVAVALVGIVAADLASVIGSTGLSVRDRVRLVERSLRPPTLYDPIWAGVRRSLGQVDAVICNDELACALLLDRVDYWLAFSERDQERFALPETDGIRRGAYGGARLVRSLTELRQVIRAHEVVWVVLIDSGKFEYAAYQEVVFAAVGRGELSFVVPATPGWTIARSAADRFHH